MHTGRDRDVLRPGPTRCLSLPSVGEITARPIAIPFGPTIWASSIAISYRPAIMRVARGGCTRLAANDRFLSIHGQAKAAHQGAQWARKMAELDARGGAAALDGLPGCKTRPRRWSSRVTLGPLAC